MRVPIIFVDAEGNLTNNHVDGWPSVQVNIQVGFHPPDDPNTLFAPQFSQVYACLDTGSNVTVIGPELSLGQTPLSDATAHNMRGAGYSAVYSALVQIVGLDKPYELEIGFAPLKSIKMLIGRDLISKYRMVLDAGQGEFYLES